MESTQSSTLHRKISVINMVLEVDEFFQVCGKYAFVIGKKEKEE